MLQFKKLTLNELDSLRPCFNYSLSRTCDNTVGGTFMWRDFFKTEYAIFDKTVIFKVVYLNGATAFSMPLGENIPQALEQIYEYCEFQKLPLYFCTAAEEDVEEYKRYFRCEVRQETDWSDYLYDAGELSSLAGKKLHGQKNHVNYFLKTYTDYTYENITSDNAASVRAFYAASPLIGSKDSAVFREEQAKVFEVLDNYAAYGMKGALLTAGGCIVAFAVGEVVGDTLFVHIEKACHDVRGAYQLIASRFPAQIMNEDGIKYVNREEDVGDAGLREAKLSYHPCAVLPKYTLTVLERI